VREEGSDQAGVLWDASDLVFTSRLAYPEARAALAAARRAHRLSDGGLRAGKRALEGRFQEIDLVDVSRDIARSAGNLAEKHGLRRYDAVHLASALVVGARDLVVVTWDRDLARASHVAGFGLAGIRLA
jgi:predicted nucleic acid-binding protein